MDAKPQPRWQGAAAAVALLVTALLIGSLLWFRFSGSQTHRPAGRVLGSVTVSNVDFKCSLPVTVYGTQAAMINFPDGQVTAETALPAVPYGKGAPSTYDAALQRWLPVQQQWVSPDGRSYAFSTTTTGIPGQAPLSDLRVRDIVTGKDRTLWQGDGTASVAGWVGTTVYFTRQGSMQQGPPPGPDVWAVDASGGGAHRVGPNPPPAPQQGGYFIGGPALLGGGAMWGYTTSQPPPSAPPAPGKPFAKGPDTLTRMDLKDGTVTAWYRSADPAAVQVIGFTAKGEPLISLFQVIMYASPPPSGFQPPAPRLMVVTGQNQATPISTDTDTHRSFGYGSATTDTHGVWLGGPGQLWLYRSGSLRKVADVPASLFPPPTPLPGVVGIASKAMVAQPSDTGPFIQVAGACT